MGSTKDIFNFNNFNTKKLNKEIITPHKISVILLIKEQCKLKEFEVLAPAHIKGFCMLSLNLIQSPDLDFASLKDLLSGKETEYRVAPLLLTKFNEQVEEILEGVGALLDVIRAAGQLIGSCSGQVTKASVLGLFLRRMLLYFDKLTFSQVVQLYKQFQVYADPTKSKTKKEEDCMGCWSRKQAELFFAREAARLLSEDPAPLQQQISHLLSGNPDYAEAHFLSFLNCVRSKEFCGAKTSLHHCFDRALLIPEKPSGANANSSTPPSDERNFRYATLSLAAMHASFGHKEEAISALKEAIKLAHESGDSVCLQHSLSWLYTFTSENKEALMERSMAKCSDLGLSYLMSLAVQSYTKYCGLTGGRPSVVFDVVMKSDVVNCQHMLSELAANSYCLRAALWTLYGQSSMASLSSQQLLRLGSLQPAVCTALCTIARSLADQGEFDMSLLVLKEAQEKFPRKECNTWMGTFQEIYFQSFLSQCKLQEVHRSVTLLGPIRPWESILRKAWLLHWQSDDVGSMNLSEKVLSHCREGWYADPELPPLKARALITAAETLEPGPALGCLLHALALAQTYYLHHLAAIITLHIANIQLNLYLPARALRLTEASLPAVLSHGTIQEQGRALLLLARCRIALEKEHRHLVLQQSIPVVLQAIELFKKARDFVRVKHCYYLQARIFNELGVFPERNRFSYEFRQLDSDYPTTPALFTTF